MYSSLNLPRQRAGLVLTGRHEFGLHIRHPFANGTHEAVPVLSKLRVRDGTCLRQP
jgi:hypothetical protein